MYRFIVLATLFAAAAASVVPLPDGRIVGGIPTTIENYPHQISLRRFGSHICGGSIYKANVIITAAHCAHGNIALALTVVAGTTFRTSGGVTRSVSAIRIHPNYSSSTTSNDVAILILSAPFSFGSSIKAIKLASAVPAIGTAVQVSGWGLTREGGTVSQILQVVEVNVVSTADCGKAYGANKITAAMFCAGVEAGGKDACQGDSGGPLIQGDELLGVVSWGYGCARKGFPGIYSNIPYLSAWIEANSQFV